MALTKIFDGISDVNLGCGVCPLTNSAIPASSVLTMLNVMYLWLPAIFCAVVTYLLTKRNVEKANAALLKEKV